MKGRKNRGGSVRAQRQRSIGTEGVYNNPAFVYAATSQVGNIARIVTASGQVWEGVFRTFSQNFDVVLEEVAKIENPEGPDSRLLTDTHKEKLIFKPTDISSLIFQNVDLDYPVMDTFQTDGAISARLNGNRSEERELEPWDAGQINGNDNISLDLETSNGWDVQEMFRKNEQEYGVQSNFDHSLRGYTVPLETSDSADYREAQAKAEQIANEIESQPAYKARLDLENGDEEAAFASVVRPNQQDSSNGKYIPPAKRNGQNNGKLVRSTPPPSSGSSSQNSPSPKETRPPVQYPTHPNQQKTHQNNIQVQNTHTPPQQAHLSQPPPQIPHGAPPPHLHNTMPPPIAPQIQNIPPPVHQQAMAMPPQHVPPPNNPQPRPTSHTPPHQYQHGPPPRQGGGHAMSYSGAPSHNKPQMNGDIKAGPQQRQQRHQQQYQQHMQERVAPGIPPGHAQGPPPSQQMAYQDVKQDSPQQYPLPQQPPPPQPRPQIPPPHQPPPRHEVPATSPQTQEAIKELHMFSQEFKLAPMPQHTSPTLPSVPPPQHIPQGTPPPAHATHASGADSPQLVAHMGAPPPIPAHSAGTSPNSSNSNMSVLNSSGTDQSQASLGPQKQPSPAQSPQSTESEKLQNTVANSKLNPNAKEFVLNPTAKPFQPRSPSTPSASRPHTPQTPSHSPYITAAVSGPGGPPMPTVMMPMHYMAISQPQYQPQPPPPQTNRIRKIPVNQIRTDMASQMQHAAAVTGQPLLAPAPLHQFIYNPGAAAAAAHGMNQAYQPTVAAMHAATIRMYDAAAAAATPTQIPYLPPQPSGTPSPAQAPYNPAAVQQPQGPPQGYQQPNFQAVPPQQAPPQIPMFCISTQPHMLQNVPYLPQAPPPGPPHQHVQVLVHQHPSQGGNPHGPNP